jgi:hypothetical protein
VIWLTPALLSDAPSFVAIANGVSMPDTGPGSGTTPDANSPAEPGAQDGDPPADFLAGLGERRRGPRVKIEEFCTIYFGSHVRYGTLHDVSPGGAMVHGVRGLVEGDLVRLRLSRLSSHAFAVEVRAVSLLGVHLAIRTAQEAALWRTTIRDILPNPPTGSSS